MNITFKKVHPDAITPSYATSGASGFDFVAIEDVTLEAGDTKLIRTGLSMSVPSGYELQIRPRSGLSLKTKLRIANSIGTVDSDFRGEIQVLMWHSGTRSWHDGNDAPIIIRKGDRIAQGVICPVIHVFFHEANSLDETGRGTGGWGSTGK